MTTLGDDYETLGDDLLPKVIKPGDYNVEVIKSTYATTGNGKHAFKLTLKVLDGPEAGTTIFDQQTWSPDSPVAARIFLQNLTKLGADPAWVKGPPRPTWEEISEHLLGARVGITTTIREFNGQDQANVSYKRPLSNGSQGSPQGGQASVLLGAAQPQQTQPQQPAQPQAAAAQAGGFTWPSA